MQLATRLDLDYSPAFIQERVSLAALSKHCQGLFETVACGPSGHSQCLWGNLHVTRVAVDEGVRFELGGCPNKLRWSVVRTQDDAGVGLVIQCAVVQREWDEAFIRSMQTLLDGLSADVQSALLADTAVAASAEPMLAACGPLAGSSRMN